MVTQIDSSSLFHIRVLFLLPLSITPPVSATCSLEGWNIQQKQQRLVDFFGVWFFIVPFCLFAHLFFFTLNWFIEFAFSVGVSPSGILEKKSLKTSHFLAAYVCVSVRELVINQSVEYKHGTVLKHGGKNRWNTDPCFIVYCGW